MTSIEPLAAASDRKFSRSCRCVRLEAEMQQLGVILTPYGANSPDGWYAELAKNVQCYTPVQSGWINTQGQGFVPGTWRFGWNPAGAYGPPSSLSGLREATATDVLAAMQAHNDRMFRLAIVSTAAVSVSA